MPVAYGGTLYSLRDHITTLRDELRSALERAASSALASARHRAAREFDDQLRSHPWVITTEHRAL